MENNKLILCIRDEVRRILELRIDYAYAVCMLEISLEIRLTASHKNLISRII